MEDCCVIVNPEARTSRKLQVISELRKEARGACVRLTHGPGEAESIAREAIEQGYRTVVAGGGDGTVNEVLRGVAGRDVKLGVLPLGTMNVFARELGLPLNWREAWFRIMKGDERRVDLGWANRMPLAQLAGVGFDARAIARVRPSLKRRWGPGAYLWAGIQELGTHLPKLRIIAEGRAPLEGVWAVIGTGRLYGGPIPVFPGGRNGEGLLKVLVIRELTVWQAFKAALVMPFGWHTQLKGITYFQTRNLRVEAVENTTDIPNLELDGELMGRTPVDFHVEPEGLRVAV